MLKQRDGELRQVAARVRRVSIACLLGVLILFSCGALRAQDQPNVIFIAVDDLNNWTGFAGYPDAITPDMDQLASEGVRFSRAYCAYPLCGPSRASLMSGVYFAELNASKTQPDDEEVEEKIEASGSSLLHTYLGDRGYKTMAVGKNLLEFALNGDPTSASNSGAIFGAFADADGDTQEELVLTIAVRNGTGSPTFTAGARGEQTATVDGLVYSVEGSLDLFSFTSAVCETPPVLGPQPSPPIGWEYRTFRLDASQDPLAEGRGFIRAGVADR